MINDDRIYNDHFRYVCRTTDIASGKSKSFSISNKKGPKIDIAIFNLHGKYYAISNTCKHVGGPLSQGLLKGNISNMSMAWVEIFRC
jgi:nitrite reductase (NADH) small subunit